VLPISTDTVAEPGPSRIDVARRRSREGYYDRPEVRRILASKILRTLAAAAHLTPEPAHESPESP
jgi:hypothetical protein